MAMCMAKCMAVCMTARTNHAADVLVVDADLLEQLHLVVLRGQMRRLVSGGVLSPREHSSLSLLPCRVR